MSAEDSRVQLEQVARYQFAVSFPGAPFPGLTVDEAPPIGEDRGPNPVHALAMAVGHCMSSTLVNTLERSHVKATPLRTTVCARIERNDRGRLRVRQLIVDIATRPLDEADRSRFDRCVEIFPEFCTVSGALREGISIDHTVRPG